MSKTEYIAERLSVSDTPCELLLRTPDGIIRTTYEDALAKKQITKKQFDGSRYGGLSRKQYHTMIGMAVHRDAVTKAIREDKIQSHPDYPDITNERKRK